MEPKRPVNKTKAKELTAKMNLKEKVRLMTPKSSYFQLFWQAVVLKHYNRTPVRAGGNHRLGIPEIKFCDGPRGLVSSHSTCFPVPMARGASFDTDLEVRIGRAIGEEIRAAGGNYYGG
ncbi:MAG: glycosyl hydrolase, partial [Spirochaetales bacterium]|nr:glycosyl hydrolase [Spirochaetales bacterium]